MEIIFLPIEEAKMIIFTPSMGNPAYKITNGQAKLIIGKAKLYILMIKMIKPAPSMTNPKAKLPNESLILGNGKAKIPKKIISKVKKIRPRPFKTAEREEISAKMGPLQAAKAEKPAK